MEDFSKLPQFTLNLRHLAFSQLPDASFEDRSLWLAKKSGLSHRRVADLLQGEAPARTDLEKFASAFGLEETVLGSAPVYGNEENTVLRENLRYLLRSLPKGEKSHLAMTIGIRPEQLSRWTKDVVVPEAKNLQKTLKFFQLDPDFDLVRSPLFLSLDPVGAYKQKEWLLTRLKILPPGAVAEVFTALKRLLRLDEKN